MKSDKEYIEKIIKNYERRKKMAVLFGVVGIIFGVAAFMVYVELGKITNELISSISSFLTEGQTIAKNDIKYVKVNNELSYVVGLRAGQTLNSFATASGISLGYCLYLLFWSRKERIIKELYGKTKI
jgi:hypothetical protein